MYSLKTEILVHFIKKSKILKSKILCAVANQKIPISICEAVLLFHISEYFFVFVYSCSFSDNSFILIIVFRIVFLTSGWFLYNSQPIDTFWFYFFQNGFYIVHLHIDAFFFSSLERPWHLLLAFSIVFLCSLHNIQPTFIYMYMYIYLCIYIYAYIYI